MIRGPDCCFSDRRQMDDPDRIVGQSRLYQLSLLTRPHGQAERADPVRKRRQEVRPRRLDLMVYSVVESCLLDMKQDRFGIGLAKALRPLLPDWMVAVNSKSPGVDDRASNEKIGDMAPVALIVRAMVLEQNRMRLTVERWIGTVHLRCDG